MYTIKKILNNNVVYAIDKSREEVILVGKSIGFKYTKNMLIPLDDISNIFTKKNNDKNNYEKVLNSINNNIIDVTEEIISMCENELDTTFNNSIHISLPDHINFAIIRIKNGQKIVNTFSVELKILFPLEYKLALKAVEILNDKLNIKLPEDEAAFICLHIKGATREENTSDYIEYTSNFTSIMNMISKLLNKKLDKNSLEYIRTLTHLKFMIERVKNGRTMKNQLLASIKEQFFKEYNIALKVALKCNSLFKITIPEDEIGYITLHLRRLIDTKGETYEK